MKEIDFGDERLNKLLNEARDYIYKNAKTKKERVELAEKLAKAIDREIAIIDLLDSDESGI